MPRDNMIEYVMSRYVIRPLGFAGFASSPGAGISSSIQQGTDQAMVVLCGGQHQGTPALETVTGHPMKSQGNPTKACFNAAGFENLHL